MTTLPARLPKTKTRFAFWPEVLALLGGILLLLWLSQVILQLDTFPEEWNLGLQAAMNTFKRWIVVNRNTHWMFAYFFEPLSAFIDFCLRGVEDFLLWVPWPVTILAFFFLGERLGGLRLALLTVFCLLPMGLFGLWDESMQTFSLMVMSVLATLSVGIPVGIWAAQNDRVEKILRPILDTMQTMPAFVYLIPVLLFFGVARVPSLIATVIYALPPAIHLTNLGLRGVSPDVIEAATAFGSTDRQILRKVKLPLAMPAIMVGVNQTIMMALGIVVIAALIGGGGLGDVVLKSLRQLRVGNALEAGLAIVFMAILLDRLSAALSRIEYHQNPKYKGYRLFQESRRGHPAVERIENSLDFLYTHAGQTAEQMAVFMGKILTKQKRWFTAHASDAATLLVLVILALILKLIGVDEFPEALRLNISKPVDALVKWMQVNLYDIGGSGIGTGPFRDFLILSVFQPLKRFLVEQLPWALILFFAAYSAFVTAGWRLALTALVMTFTIGLFGMWEFAMDTLGQALVAVVLCVLVGIPLGIWASHNDRVDQLLRPILDFLQTIPIFVYLVPVIMLFGTGSIAGLISSLLYAVVPVIRLTNAGIREVDVTLRESATAFGSTPMQMLFKVEIPLAFPSIMLGINQTIMMVLAMVIIAGLVGATGLGQEVYQGFANDDLGRSTVAGLAIVLCAIVIDRITQAMARKVATETHLAPASH
ncbi:MAG: ABC transporter permease subunit [Anaerolineales bacterium]|nr:ABC transporter permease subunit [Anaerolineales bacterium]